MFQQISRLDHNAPSKNYKSNSYSRTISNRLKSDSWIPSSFEALFKRHISNKLQTDISKRSNSISFDDRQAVILSREATSPVPDRIVVVCQSPRSHLQLAKRVNPEYSLQDKQSHSSIAALLPLILVSLEERNESNSCSAKTLYEMMQNNVIRSVYCDPRKICTGKNTRLIVRRLKCQSAIDLLSSTWAGLYFKYIAYGRRMKKLSSMEVSSLEWIVCQYIRKEASERASHQAQLREKLSHQLIEFRLAVQCLTGLVMIKYGRKGKPHLTQLSMQNSETIRWSSKKLASSHKKSLQFIDLTNVIGIQSGQSSQVFQRAIQKGVAGDQSCCLSLITTTRTLDLRARSETERDWLVKAFQLVITQARENAKKASEHVETCIIRKIQSMTVMKHGRKGKPHLTYLRIDQFGHVTWKGKSNGKVKLSEITNLVKGQQTQVFERMNLQLRKKKKWSNEEDCLPSRCLSLITTSRTLDLEVSNEEERDWLLVAFQYLIQKTFDRIREQKRLKAERGVRLLQEAYSYHAKRMQNMDAHQNANLGDLERYPGYSTI